MGRSGSSSKRKHSKKKSLKVSSEGRRKKIRRNKSKKLRHREDSFSSYSDDVSTSSSPVSSSGSEDEYKTRKSRSRSRTRSELKSSRKRTRRRSSSEESTESSPPVKKRKRSKKKRDSEKRKKSKKMKKSRKDAYSSDSESCSTCKEGDSSSDDVASHDRSRGRSKEKKKGRNGNRKNRSSSPSKLSESYDYDDDNIEKVIVENNSRRLKSVITIANRLEDEEELNDVKKDELKEEIVYDYDDYPSCKSNDSNDGENKKELNDRSIVSPEKKGIEVNSDSSFKDNKSIKEEEKVDDLESILRQKALENLSRFRGGLQTKTVGVPVEDKRESQSESGQTGVKKSTGASVDFVQSQSTIQKSRFTWRRDTSVSKLQSDNLSSSNRVENKIENENMSEIKANNESNNVGDIETADIEVNEEGSSKEVKSETKDNSQFEKKTMSVMRGGEMVQVSYKVYIPNRAPALARRRLKR